MHLVTAQQMRAMDQRTILHHGIPGIVLMEHAAIGAVEILLAHFKPTAGTQIGILCGVGNNGGDGLAMARILHSRGFKTLVVILGDLARLSKEARINYTIVANLGLRLIHFSDDSVFDGEALDEFHRCDVWCDALFGIGLKRPISGVYSQAIDYLNTKKHIFAIDLPSGLHADTGNILGTAVRANATATMGYIKLGQVLYPGRQNCGSLYQIDVGLPPCSLKAIGYEASYLTNSWANSIVFKRPPTFHKGDAGSVLILGGQVSMAGSILLSTEAALLSGAGLITVGTCADCISQVAQRVPEAMAQHLLDANHQARLNSALSGALTRSDCVAIGPGMGVSSSTRDVLLSVFRSPVDKIVIDADGLNTIAHFDLFDELSKAASNRTIVLTPHPGEIARLCQCSIDDIVRAPVQYARTLAQRLNCIVVLKMASTIITAPDGQLAINSSGNPGMATGGMGDALTGMIAALLCQHNPWIAICLAVYVHGAAADERVKLSGQRGLSVTGMLHTLSIIWQRLES